MNFLSRRLPHAPFADVYGFALGRIASSTHHSGVGGAQGGTSLSGNGEVHTMSSGNGGTSLNGNGGVYTTSIHTSSIGNGGSLLSTSCEGNGDAHLDGGMGGST